MSSTLTPWLSKRCNLKIQKLQDQGQLRVRQPMDFISATHLKIEQRSFLQFASNDYLGLACEHKLAAGFSGAGASPLVSGYSSVHAAFEAELAAYLGFDAALYFNAGFTANESMLNLLLDKKDVVFSDKLNHASLIDGVLKSGARQYRYQHLDIADLERLLQTKPVPTGGQRWIISDTVFSMDGDIAPLVKIVALAKRYDAAVYFDDAHGFGVFGEGRGTCAALGIPPEDIDVLMVTCGKAMGVMGAVVLGSAPVILYAVQASRAYIYSTAVPPQVLQSCLYALRMMIHATDRRLRLQALSLYLSECLTDVAHEFGYQVKPVKAHCLGFIHPVQPLILGQLDTLAALNTWLLDQGILVGAIRPPTVPVGTARLRISLNSMHSHADIKVLCETIGAFKANT